MEYIERGKSLLIYVSEDAYEQLQRVPAADVVARDCYDRLLVENDELRKKRPVRRGRWIWDGYAYDAPWQCSNCRVFHDDDSNYCPNCGALMDMGW